MFIAALLIIAKNWNQITTKLWYSHRMEYSTAIKRNNKKERAVTAKTWMNRK